ncbi:MAG: quinone-dependent dihydroorotate dehydrogenase [Deltaproteobacteria bacterium]|nr:quinone-dependent dihydroorotate dehydrogenase [Deltaproteobacteria bacterium]
MIRPVLFSLDAERAHEWTLRGLEAAPGLLGRIADVTMGVPRLSRPGFGGLTLAGPVGLAAGLDKDGRAIAFWPHLGFGFVELGTVTLHAQPGNPQPRLFRLPAERALINRMGFNNHGSAALAARIRRLRERGTWPEVPVGANLGKSKVTANEDAVGDYVGSTRLLCGLVDWLTVNVSSPNTPGLRALQDERVLAELLPAVVDAARGTAVLLKLAPDLGDDGIRAAVDIAHRAGAAGIVATNTTLRRDPLRADPGQAGGLSGAPLWRVARPKIGVALEAAAGRLPVVGVGGIETAEQVTDLLAAGCVAVQLYSGLIFQGPGLPARLTRAVEAA